MKKIIEKHGMLKCIGALMDLIGIILLAVSYFVDATTGEIIGGAMYNPVNTIENLKNDPNNLA